MTLTPQPSDRFTFGLWTVGNVGRDPFGEPTRQPLKLTYIVEKRASLGAYGVSLHDNDRVPHGGFGGMTPISARGCLRSSPGKGARARG